MRIRLDGRAGREAQCVLYAKYLPRIQQDMPIYPKKTTQDGINKEHSDVHMVPLRLEEQTFSHRRSASPEALRRSADDLIHSMYANVTGFSSVMTSA